MSLLSYFFKFLNIVSIDDIFLKLAIDMIIMNDFEFDLHRTIISHTGCPLDNLVVRIGLILYSYEINLKNKEFQFFFHT